MLVHRCYRASSVKPAWQLASMLSTADQPELGRSTVLWIVRVGSKAVIGLSPGSGRSPPGRSADLRNVREGWNEAVSVCVPTPSTRASALDRQAAGIPSEALLAGVARALAIQGPARPRNAKQSTLRPACTPQKAAC